MIPKFREKLREDVLSLFAWLELEFDYISYWNFSILY